MCESLDVIDKIDTVPEMRVSETDHTMLATPTFDLIVVSEVDSKTTLPNPRAVAL